MLVTLLAIAIVRIFWEESLEEVSKVNKNLFNLQFTNCNCNFIMDYKLKQ
jgi:hypothetical protein